MAHFAELDNKNNVLRVVVISNDDIVDDNGIEQESIGVQVCRNIFGADTTWKQTSYNGTFRKKYAGIGDTYSLEGDVFYDPNPPFPSWVLDTNYDWCAPTPKPNTEKEYEWDEPSLQWVEITSNN